MGAGELKVASTQPKSKVQNFAAAGNFFQQRYHHQTLQTPLGMQGPCTHQISLGYVKKHGSYSTLKVPMFEPENGGWGRFRPRSSGTPQHFMAEICS